MVLSNVASPRAGLGVSVWIPETGTMYVSKSALNPMSVLRNSLEARVLASLYFE